MALTVVDILLKIASQGAKEAARDVDSLGKSTDSFASRATKAGQKLTLGLTAPILGFAAKSVFAASDVAEAQSAVNTVYGKSAGVISKFAEGAATNLGMSEQQALAAAGSLGALGKSVGLADGDLAKFSTSTIQAATDLGSFYNVDPQQALQDLRSGLVGEAEPLRKYGILLSEGAVQQKAFAMTGKTVAKSLTEQEKVAARQALILDQLGAATGDFARTQGGLANQMRIAKASFSDMAASIGVVLLPTVLKAVTGLAKFFQSVSRMSPQMRKIVVVVGLLAAAIGPLLIVLGTLASAATAVATAFGAGGALAFIVPLLGPIALIVGALALLGIAYKTNFLGFGDAVRYVAGAVADGFSRMTKWFSGLIKTFQMLRSMGINPVTAAFYALANGLQGIDAGPFQGILNFVIKTLQLAGRVVAAFAKRFTAAFGQVIYAFKRIKKAFDTGGIRGAIDELFGEGGKALLRGVGKLLALLPRAIGEFLRGIKTGFAPLDNLLHGVGKIFTDIGLLIQNIFAGEWGKAFEYGKRLVMDLVQNFQNQLMLLVGIFQVIPWDALWDGLKAAIRTAADLFKTIPWGAIATAAWNGIKAAFAAIPWSDLPGQVWGLIKAGFAAIPWSSIGDFLAGAGGWLLEKGKQVAQGLRDGIEIVWNKLLDWLGGRAGAIKGAVGDLGATLVAKGSQLVAGLREGIDEKWRDLQMWFGNLDSPDGPIRQAIGDLSSALVEKGKQLLKGLKSGIEAGWLVAKLAVSGLQTKIQDVFKGALSWLEQAGKDVINGLKAGFESAWSGLESWVNGKVTWLTNKWGTITGLLDKINPVGNDDDKRHANPSVSDPKGGGAINQLTDRDMPDLSGLGRIAEGAFGKIVEAAKTARQNTLPHLTGIGVDALRAVTTMSSQVGARVSGFASDTNRQFSQLRSTSASTTQGMSTQVVNAFNTMRNQTSSAANSLRSSVTSAFQGARSSASSSMDAIRGRASQLVGELRSAGAQAGNSFRSGLADGMNAAVGAAQNALSRIRGAVSGFSLYSAGSYIGGTLGQGIVSGMNSWLGSIASAAANLVNTAINAARAAAGNPRSPSPVTRKRVGGPLGEGVWAGWNDWLPAIREVAKKAAAAGTPGAIQGGSTLGSWRLAGAGTAGRMPRSTGSWQPAVVNHFAVMTRQDLDDFFAASDTVRVITNRSEMSAVYGGS